MKSGRKEENIIGGMLMVIQERRKGKGLMRLKKKKEGGNMVKAREREGRKE